MKSRLLLCAALTALSLPALAQESGGDAAAMARAMQDPLASIKALMTDNTISFDGGPNDDTTYNFQLQPVYAIPNETDYNMVFRGVIPIIGLEPGVVQPPLGPGPAPDRDSTWGLSDTIAQLYFSPRSDSSFKWGIGPQVSLKTHTSDRVAGPGWGAGIAAVAVAGSGNWAYAALIGNHWGEDDFEQAMIQPMVFYNVESVPGMAIGYSNTLTYNWDASSGNKWNVPLGLTISRTFPLASGNGVDLSVGGYRNVERPDNAPEWQFKFGISFIFN